MTRKKSTEHIALGNNSLRCHNCGTEQLLEMPLSLRVMLAMTSDFEDGHLRCAPSDAGAARMRYATPEEWIRSWDTGASSITLFRHMMGQPMRNPSAPLDPSDFGRCYRLLKAFPAWRARIDEFLVVPEWKPLVEAWTSLEALYEEELIAGSGSAPKLHAEMKRLTGGG